MLKNILYAILAIALVVMIPVNRNMIKIYYEDKKLTAQQNYEELKQELNNLKESLNDLRNKQRDINLQILEIEQKIKYNNDLINDMYFNQNLTEYNQYDTATKKH